ncbi:MAG: threonine--tRNA ligase [Verrucomicrobiae bacterium]|nr:threonine--tRNA ligase [Verrucomicrobiae bacterium]
MSDLERLRHSCAHVMATAVMRLWPDTKLDVGPPTEEGFYYDFDSQHRFVPEDLPRIEEEMQKVVDEKQPFQRHVFSRDQALDKIKQLGQPLKVIRLADIPQGEEISFYQNGEFWDLCAGPHVEHTGKVRAFKLLSIAGTYFKGDARNPQLQRLYGTAFADPKELRTYLHALEEAKKRDHRKLGRELKLFTISPMVGGGLPLLLPRGAVIRRELERFIEEKLDVRGFQRVYTPHIGNLCLYQTSGHYPYYKDSMYQPVKIDQDEYLLKPMNCPMHIQIYANEPKSYRELPVRLAEFGTVYRYEQSGELNGLTRVRGFTQDDGHIFCTPEQLKDEVKDAIRLVTEVLDVFQMPYQTRVSLSDPNDTEKYAGQRELWEKAEGALQEIVAELNIPTSVGLGEAAFYGPKLDFMIKDAIGRSWQLCTIQVDYSLPERFGLEFIGSDGQAHRPVMIHRAVFGSVERFMAVLIEHFAGAFPLWLAPEQARVLPISSDQLPYAEEVANALRAAKIRVTVDHRTDKINGKIRNAQVQKIPYMLVVGAKELSERSVSVRTRQKGDEGCLALDALVERLSREIASRALPQ